MNEGLIPNAVDETQAASAPTVPVNTSEVKTVSTAEAETVSAKNEIDKTSIVQVIPTKKRPEDDLKVIMGRQSCEFHTAPGWPSPDSLTKPINYVVRGDGIWEVRHNNVGFFVVKRADAKLPGFPKEDNAPWFWLRHGKIPYSRLQEIIYFFKHICDESKDEVYMQILWDEEKQEYFNYCPKQKVSGASVNYDRDPELEARCPLVLEIHSHNTMNAYFSSVDDADEKGDRLFGVIGELNKTKPAWKMSFVCGGKRQDIPHLSTIFTEAPEEQQLFPPEWRERVTKGYGNPYSSGAGSNYSGYSAYSGQNYKADTQKTETQGGARQYRHQNFYSGDGDADGRKGWESQGRSETSSAGRKPSEEVQETVSKVFNKARADVDESLKARDFIKDNPLIDVDNADPLALTASDGDGSRALDYDNTIEALIGQIEETFLQSCVLESNMSDTHKEELFNSLIASLRSEDVSILIQCLVANDHSEEMMQECGMFGDVDQTADRQGSPE